MEEERLGMNKGLGDQGTFVYLGVLDTEFLRWYKRTMTEKEKKKAKRAMTKRKAVRDARKEWTVRRPGLLRWSACACEMLIARLRTGGEYRFALGRGRAEVLLQPVRLHDQREVGQDY